MSMPYSCLHPVCLAHYQSSSNMSMPYSCLHPVCLAHYQSSSNMSMPYSCLHPDCLADYSSSSNISMPQPHLHPDCLADYRCNPIWSALLILTDQDFHSLNSRANLFQSISRFRPIDIQHHRNIHGHKHYNVMYIQH